jgi:hypothetical protein
MVVYEHALHFEIGLFTRGLLGIFDKGVLQAVAGPLVADDLAGEDFAEAAED